MHGWIFISSSFTSYIFCDDLEYIRCDTDKELQGVHNTHVLFPSINAAGEGLNMRIIGASADIEDDDPSRLRGLAGLATNAHTC